MKESQSAIAMVLVETGSHLESKKESGIAHFLEHMCFKGTEKRTYEDIITELDSLGAESNAFTSFEHTGYYSKAHFKKVGNILEILSDMYLNQSLPEQEIEKERGVILDEINMYLDLPPRVCWYALRKSMYGDTPAGRTVIGDPKTVKEISKKDFINFRDKFYNASNTVIVVAGNIDQKHIKSEVEKHFGKLKKGQRTKHLGVKYRQGPNIEIVNKKTDQTRMILGFKSFNMYDKRMPETMVLANLLGGGMSSRLFRKLREERGLCYSVNAGVGSYVNNGEFTISLGVHNKKAVESLKLIYEELKDLKNNLASPKELKKVKDFIIGNFAIGLETSSDYADYFGFQEIHKEEILKPAEYIKKIKAVTPEMVQKAAREIFKNNFAHLAIVGLVKEKKKFQEIMSAKNL